MSKPSYVDYHNSPRDKDYRMDDLRACLGEDFPSTLAKYLKPGEEQALVPLSEEYSLVVKKMDAHKRLEVLEALDEMDEQVRDGEWEQGYVYPVVILDNNESGPIWDQMMKIISDRPESLI